MRYPIMSGSPHPHGQEEAFTFGIPLIASEVAHNWEPVDALLSLTLRSVLAQTDGNFRVVLVGHRAPPCWAALTNGDPRFRFIAADWSPGGPTSRNDDGGRKKWLIKEHIRQADGGLLMFLDADDLVDRSLVEASRAEIDAACVGAIVDHGIALDFRTLKAVSLPDPRVFNDAFHRVCGSSTVGRLDPRNSNAARRDPHESLGSHHLWPEAATDAGVPITRLPVWGAYIVNTSENQSERHGPNATGRRSLNRAITESGAFLGPAPAGRFGMDHGALTAIAG